METDTQLDQFRDPIFALSTVHPSQGHVDIPCWRLSRDRIGDVKHCLLTTGRYRNEGGCGQGIFPTQCPDALASGTDAVARQRSPVNSATHETPGEDHSPLGRVSGIAWLCGLRRRNRRPASIAGLFVCRQHCLRQSVADDRLCRAASYTETLMFASCCRLPRSCRPIVDYRTGDDLGGAVLGMRRPWPVQ